MGYIGVGFVGGCGAEFVRFRIVRGLGGFVVFEEVFRRRCLVGW